MRRRARNVCLLTAGLALALLAAACGGSRAVVTGTEAVASGNAVLQGTVVGASEGLRVTAIGTAASAPVDEDGQFLMSSLPAGTASLRFEGSGVAAQLSVSGLQDGLVTTINVTISGASAQLNGPASCQPSAGTFFSGNLEQTAGTRLVVAGRPVDVSEIRKVWRGERRIQLSDLQAGERVKVWGVLRGDGVVLAEEIAALTSGGESGETWASFSGKVEAVSSSSLAARGVHADPNGGSYPTLLVAGRTVYTSPQTTFRWSDRGTLDPRDIRAGQSAYVEGWKRADGGIRCTSLRIEGSSPASGGGASWTTFRGRVDSVVALERAGGVIRLDGRVAASCNLRLTVAGRRVETDGGTTFKWSDGSGLDPYAVVVGDQAYVEGWSKPEGYVLATKLVVDKR